jgi:hypothetical protein
MSKKLTINEFVDKATKIHNNKYDYSKSVYINGKTKTCILCPTHGLFWQTPDAHLQRQGCKKCGFNKIGNKLSSNKEEFINRSKTVHRIKYDYSKVEYKNALTKVTIVCPLHGEFAQTPMAHLKGRRCQKCGVDLQKLSMIYSNDEYIYQAKLLHKNTYDYSKINYVNAHTKICIRCKKHGDFYQTPNSHLNGNGCPKCIHIISEAESNFLDYIKINYRQVHIKPYKVDGYDPATKTIYEFLGDYWHGNPTKFNPDTIHPRVKKTYGQLYKITIEKFLKLNNLGYNVKYIWESDWENFKNGIDPEPKILNYN